MHQLLTPTITPTESPTITPTESPSSFPTRKQIPVDSQSYVTVEVTQTLIGISSLEADLNTAKVFKSAVARVLASYSISVYDISIESYKDLRRRLYEYNERALANSVEVSYEIFFGAQKAGFSDTSSAASAIISTLTAAVQSSIFNDAIAIEAAAVYGPSVTITVTTGNTITARDASNDFQNSLNDLVEAYRTYQITVAVAVILSIFLFFCFCWCTMFCCFHKRCPRLGRPVLNPFSTTDTDDTKFEKASTTDTNAVEITIVSKDFANKEVHFYDIISLYY